MLGQVEGQLWIPVIDRESSKQVEGYLHAELGQVEGQPWIPVIYREDRQSNAGRRKAVVTCHRQRGW
jgi:hypothetical protein